MISENDVIRVMTGALRELKESLLTKLREDVRGYFEAHQKGWILNQPIGSCCKEFNELSSKLWNQAYAFNGLKGFDAQALTYCGKSFNWCPFCGRKI